MGADFIILRHDLDDDPHVIRVAELLDLPVGHVIDAFRRLWRHVSLHTERGFLPGCGCETIDRITCTRGLARAACEVGWLEVDLRGAQVPNFDEYLSVRAIQVACRDFLKEHPLPEKLQEVWPGFDAWYEGYPRKVARGAALKAWNQMKPSEEFQKELARRLEEDKAREQWKRDRGRYVPYPATWLRRQVHEEKSDGPGEDVGQPGRVRSQPGKYAGLARVVVTQEAPAPGAGGEALLFPPEGEGDRGHPPGPA